MRKAKVLTGNKAITSELTDLELRVIGIIGAEYVEGSKSCAENIPEEENLIEKLEQGNDEVITAIPQVISICPDIPQEISQDSENANFFDNYHNNNDKILNGNCSLLSNALEDNTIIEIGDSDDTPNSIGNRKSKKAPKAISIKNNRNIPYTVPKPAEQSNSMENIQEPSTSSRKFNRATSTKQLHSSRESFQSIAQKQAVALFMHAECATIQAEICRMNALAMTKIADATEKMADTAAIQAVNDSKRIKVFEKLTKILENVLPTYMKE